MRCVTELNKSSYQTLSIPLHTRDNIKQKAYPCDQDIPFRVSQFPILICEQKYTLYGGSNPQKTEEVLIAAVSTECALEEGK
jgi:hypothetical protein